MKFSKSVKGTKKWKFLIFWGRIPTPLSRLRRNFVQPSEPRCPSALAAKFELNRCNKSPLRGEKPEFWPVSKFNTGSLPLRGILPVKMDSFLWTRCRRGFYPSHFTFRSLMFMHSKTGPIVLLVTYDGILKRVQRVKHL